VKPESALEAICDTRIKHDSASVCHHIDVVGLHRCASSFWAR